MLKLLCFFQDNCMNVAQELIEIAFHLNFSGNTIIVDNPNGYLAFMDEFVIESIIDELDFNFDLLNNVKVLAFNNDSINICLEGQDQDEDYYDVDIYIALDGTPISANVSSWNFEKEVSFG